MYSDLSFIDFTFANLFLGWGEGSVHLSTGIFPTFPVEICILAYQQPPNVSYLVEFGEGMMYTTCWLIIVSISNHTVF